MARARTSPARRSTSPAPARTRTESFANDVKLTVKQEKKTNVLGMAIADWLTNGIRVLFVILLPFVIPLGFAAIGSWLPAICMFVVQVPGFVCLGCLDVLTVSLSAIASAAWSIACVPSELVTWFASAIASIGSWLPAMCMFIVQVPGFVCLGCLDVLAVSLSAIASAAWSIACVPSELVSWFASATTSAVAVASDAAHVLAETGSDDLWSAMAGLVGSWSDPGPIGAFVFFALVALGGCVLGAFICARIDALITFLETSGWLDQLLRGTRTAARCCGFQPAVHAAGMMHDAGPAIGRMMATVWQAVVTVWSVVVSADRFVFDGLTTCITDVVSLVRNAFVRLVIGSCATAIHLGYIAPVAGAPPTLYNSYYYNCTTTPPQPPTLLPSSLLTPWRSCLSTRPGSSKLSTQPSITPSEATKARSSLRFSRQLSPASARSAR